MRKSHGRIGRQCNPEMPVAQGLLQFLLAGGLAKNGVRRVAGKKPRRGQLDLRELTEMFWPRPNDRIVRCAGRLTRETLQRRLDQARELRVRRDTLRVQPRSIQRHGDRCLTDYTRGHDRQRLTSELQARVARLEAFTRATGLSTSSPLPTTQSSAFFRTPGTPCAYSGLETKTASADRSAARNSQTGVGGVSVSRSGLNGGSWSRSS